MLFRCSSDNCGKQLRTGNDGSFHGEECFSCGGKLVAVTFHRQGVEYDLTKIAKELDLDRRGGRYTQKDVGERCGEDATYVSRMVRGERPMKDNLADTLLSLVQQEGHAPGDFVFDGASESVDALDEALSEDSGDGSFPIKKALKVQSLTREGASNGEVEATFGFRRLKLWQRAYIALRDAGHNLRQSLGAAYWVAHAYKLDDEGQLFAEELFQRVFGADPVKPTAVLDSREMEHPMEAVVRFFAKRGFHIYSYGETGDSKSFSTERTARAVSEAEENRIAVVSGHEALSTEDFIASGAARGDGAGGTETYTELRTLPLCMQRGMPLVLDEPCVVRPSILMSLQRVLEEGKLHIPEADMEIEAQEGFRVFLTDNTRGLAEDPRYATRRVLDEAFRDRFLFLHFENMPPKMAVDILEQDAEQYSDALEEGDAEALEDTAEERRTEIVEDDDNDPAEDASDEDPASQGEDAGDIDWTRLGN